MAGMFDPDSFLDAEVEGANETERVLVPTGVYNAFIEDIAVRNGEKDDGDPWAQLVIKWNLEDESVKESLNRDKVILSDYMFVDLDDEGRIATGVNKNVPLGKLRKATGTNEGRFSPRMLIGQRCMLMVQHEQGKNGPREVVKGFAAIA